MLGGCLFISWGLLWTNRLVKSKCGEEGGIEPIIENEKRLKDKGQRVRTGRDRACKRPKINTGKTL